jgi:hypothetical protein
MNANATTTRTARRRTLRIAAAALTAVAGLTLTACSGSDAAGNTGGKSGSATEVQGSDAQSEAKPGAKPDAKPDAETGAEATTAPDAQAGAEQGAKNEPSKGKQAAGPNSADNNTGVAASERCHTSGLKAAFATGGDAAPDPNASGSTTTSVLLTNKGSRACVLGGFPGVDLKTENDGETWSLQRSSAKHGSIKLAPGETTEFTINLVLAEEGADDFWMPAYAVITPPNETTSLRLDWPWGAPVDQRGATHPGTFVNPIG